jgi:hypothetical protein
MRVVSFADSLICGKREQVGKKRMKGSLICGKGFVRFPSHFPQAWDWQGNLFYFLFFVYFFG